MRSLDYRPAVNLLAVWLILYLCDLALLQMQ